MRRGEIKTSPLNRGQRRKRCGGVTLIETVLSLLILGGAFVAVLNSVASARASQSVAADRQYARILAEDLMAEILNTTTYKEDDTMGPEVGEFTGTRSAFDDIDDYKNWTSTPPTEMDGTPIPGAEGLTRRVWVLRAQLDSPNDVAPTDEGLMLIVVAVYREGKQLSLFAGYRSDVWQAPQENY